MEMQELEITIDNEGRVQVRVSGTRGPDCLALTKNLEESLGTVDERVYSAAYYEQPVTQQQECRNSDLR